MKEKLSALPVSELREIAKEKGIKGVSTLRKQQLVDMLAELDSKNDGITHKDEVPNENGETKSKIHGVAPGQFCVIYDSAHYHCLGSGEITV